MRSLKACVVVTDQTTTRGEQEDFDKFLLLISPSLRIKVQNHIFKERFKKNKVIQFTIKQYETQEEEAALQ